MKYLLIIYCFCALYLSGTSFLDFIGWPTYGDGYRYPGPSFIFLIFMFVICIIKQRRLDKYKYEFVGMILLTIILLFNKMTGRVVPLKEMAVGLFAPFMLSVAIKRVGNKANRSILINLYVYFFIINSLVAVFEQVTHIYVLGMNSEFTSNSFGFRSHAFLGHPLSNSAFTANLMVFFLISPFSLKKKIGFWLLGFIALLCFNSRFSIVLSVIVCFVWAFKEFFFDQHYTRGNIIYLIVPVMVCVVGISLFSAGYGQRLINLGLDDNSADARIKIWDLFNYINWSDLLFGINRKRQDMLMYISGNEDLIMENCWIIFVLLYGYIFTICMLFYYTVMFRRFLFRYSTWQASLVMVSWLLTISTSNSIAHGGGIASMLFLIFVFEPQKQNALNRLKYFFGNKIDTKFREVIHKNSF